MSDGEGRQFIVVANEERQLSEWPAGRPIPEGWRDEGVWGPQGACRQYIEEALRTRQSQGAQQQESAADEATGGET